MNRKSVITKHISQTGCGLEIGPSHNPIAPKKEGYNVDIIDHMSREQLIEKYQGHGVNLDNIEDVDYVWQGEPYAELTGKTKHYDWIIASHVIEHTPDLIGFLNDCDTILKDDGVIALAVPDKRYCFDHFRPISGLSSIIDAHIQHKTTHSPGTVAEYYLNIVSQNGSIAWNKKTTGKYEFLNTLEDARNGIESAGTDQQYTDVHAWCFVPHSFRLILEDLYQLGLVPFREVDYSPAKGCEFFITLGRSGSGSNKSRLELLDQIDAEQCEVSSRFKIFRKRLA